MMLRLKKSCLAALVEPLARLAERAGATLMLALGLAVLAGGVALGAVIPHHVGVVVLAVLASAVGAVLLTVASPAVLRPQRSTRARGELSLFVDMM